MHDINFIIIYLLFTLLCRDVCCNSGKSDDKNAKVASTHNVLSCGDVYDDTDIEVESHKVCSYVHYSWLVTYLRMLIAYVSVCILLYVV